MSELARGEDLLCASLASGACERSAPSGPDSLVLPEIVERRTIAGGETVLVVMGETAGSRGVGMKRMQVGWAAAAVGLLLTGCVAAAPAPPAVVVEEPATVSSPGRTVPDPPSRPITLAFAGDVHFQLQVAALLEGRGARLGRAGHVLASADLARQPGSAITDRGVPGPEGAGGRLETATGSALLRPPSTSWPGQAWTSSAWPTTTAPTTARSGCADTLHAAEHGPLAVVGRRPQPAGGLHAVAT